jgi:hypothetical protein
MSLASKVAQNNSIIRRQRRRQHIVDNYKYNNLL